MKRIPMVAFAAFFLLPLACAPQGERQPAEPTASGQGNYGDLVRLFEEFEEFRKPNVVDGVADYTVSAMQARYQGLAEHRRRLEAINPREWSIPEQVDYLLVKGQINSVDFDHRVLRPWARDPGFYAEMVGGLALTDVPLQQDEALAEFSVDLKTVPLILEQARGNLTEVPRDLALHATKYLDQEVGQGPDPLRGVPVSVLFEDLAERLSSTHPGLVSDAEAAANAVRNFNDWLKEEMDNFGPSAGIGVQEYNWLLKNVRFLPLTMDEVRIIANRELDRSLSFLKIEENENRNLLKLQRAANREDYMPMVRKYDQQIRNFIREQGILTIPDYIGELDRHVPWVERPDGTLRFWEEIQYRDSRPDHVHATIPGHQFDGILQRHLDHPIRGPISQDHWDSHRVEGWGTYVEEMMQQAGLLKDRPRTEELFYIFNQARAVRVPSELRMHTGEYTLEEAVSYMMEDTAYYMDEGVAWGDCQHYLRTPSYGIAYTMGKVQIEALMADRARHLGEEFNLKEFHDEFLSKGWLPISLIRYEMTGFDDEVKEFW